MNQPKKKKAPPTKKAAASAGAMKKVRLPGLSAAEKTRGRAEMKRPGMAEDIRRGTPRGDSAMKRIMPGYGKSKKKTK